MRCKSIRRRLATAILGLAVVAVSCRPARAATDGYWLASQHELSNKKGYYLGFENVTASGPHQLSTLKLLLMYGNGSTWRYLTKTPIWQWGTVYTAKAVVGPAGGELWFNGTKVSSATSLFTPSPVPSVTAGIPWQRTSGTRTYFIQQTALRLTTTASNGTNRVLDVPLPTSGRSDALYLFEPQNALNVNWPLAAGEKLTIEAAFSIKQRPDPASFAPLIDAYGQHKLAQWTGKTGSVADLQATIVDEQQRYAAWGAPANYDIYGGYTQAGWSVPGTGYFRTLKRNGYWWLISPLGNPCFYIGLCSAPGLDEFTPTTSRENLFEWLPPHDTTYAKAWRKNIWNLPAEANTDFVSFNNANLIRKYGSTWESKNTQTTKDRLKYWGFSGVGKWSSDLALPRFPILRRTGVPTLAGHPDVFDATVCFNFAENLRQQVQPSATNARIVGWSLGNEYAEIIQPAEVQQILLMGATVAAKRAFVDYAVDTLYAGSVAQVATAWGVTASTRNDLYASQPTAPAGDVESLRRFYADRYYRFIYDTVKSYDPNHLYMGFWIVPNWWVNDEDWRLIGRNCDLIGYDRYARDFNSDQMTQLMQQTDKPVFCGEFSFPAWYNGERGFGAFGTFTQDDSEAASTYTAWARDAAQNPYCVGFNWFEYRDQHITGRGSGFGPEAVYGEHYAFGLVDVSDKPKWTLVSALRTANLQAVKQRLQAGP